LPQRGPFTAHLTRAIIPVPNIREPLRGNVTYRYLQFTNIEDGQKIVAWCSLCDRTFVAEPENGKSADDLILQVRADFEKHICPEAATQFFLPDA
jgi:hypothetical protein